MSLRTGEIILICCLILFGVWEIIRGGREVRIGSELLLVFHVFGFTSELTRKTRIDSVPRFFCFSVSLVDKLFAC